MEQLFVGVVEICPTWGQTIEMLANRYPQGVFVGTSPSNSMFLDWGAIRANTLVKSGTKPHMKWKAAPDEGSNIRIWELLKTLDKWGRSENKGALEASCRNAISRAKAAMKRLSAQKGMVKQLANTAKEYCSAVVRAGDDIPPTELHVNAWTMLQTDLVAGDPYLFIRYPLNFLLPVVVKVSDDPGILDGEFWLNPLSLTVISADQDGDTGALIPCAWVQVPDEVGGSRSMNFEDLQALVSGSIWSMGSLDLANGISFETITGWVTPKDFRNKYKMKSPLRMSTKSDGEGMSYQTLLRHLDSHSRLGIGQAYNAAHDLGTIATATGSKELAKYSAIATLLYEHFYLAGFTPARALAGQIFSTLRVKGENISDPTLLAVYYQDALAEAGFNVSLEDAQGLLLGRAITRAWQQYERDPEKAFSPIMMAFLDTPIEGLYRVDGTQCQAKDFMLLCRIFRCLAQGRLVKLSDARLESHLNSAQGGALQSLLAEILPVYQSMSATVIKSLETKQIEELTRE